MALNLKFRSDRTKLLADAVMISHFVVANLVLVIGNFSSVFDSFHKKFGGAEFLFQTLDYPVYWFLQGYIGKYQDDPLYIYMVAELIIIVSSALYGFAAYLAGKFIQLIFD